MSERDGCRVDLHVKVLNEAVVERAKDRGLDVLVYAPHFTRLPDIRERAAAFSDDELLVVPGRELFTGTWRTRKHVLAIGLSEPIPDFITLEGAMDELARQDAAVLVPHPEFATVSLDEDDVRRYDDAIDAIEVYNPKHWASHNERARAIARSIEKPIFASSYAHLTGTIGEVWTTFEREITSADDLVDALQTGAPRRVFHRDGRTHDLRRAAEFAHLAWENSWCKIDRVFLSGAEPTHPDHIAYDGAFADVSAY